MVRECLWIKPDTKKELEKIKGKKSFNELIKNLIKKYKMKLKKMK